MTGENIHLKQTAAAIVNRVIRKTILLVLIAAVGALLYNIVSGTGGSWWSVPASMIFGGALGLANFRWLAITVERVYVRRGATPAIANIAGSMINILKLAAIFIILFIVIKWQIMHIIGLLIGLSICFLAIVWEGLTVMTAQAVDSRQ